MSGDKVFTPYFEKEHPINSTPLLHSFSEKVFKPFFQPKSIKNLLDIEDFRKILTNGFFFIHYKKDSVTHLTRELLSFHDNIHFENTNKTAFKDIIHKIVNYSKENRTKVLWIIDTIKYGEDLSRMYNTLSKIKNFNDTSVCIRSHIENMNFECFESFDILFFFDMSRSLSDRLKNFIKIPNSYIDSLESSLGFQGEPVLIFVNYEKLRNKQNIPYFSNNPFIVDCESSLVFSSNEKEVKMSGNTYYNIGSVQGAVGNSATAEGSTFSQYSNNLLDLKQLSIELDTLQRQMELEASPQNRASIDEVIMAKNAAIEGNQSKVLSHLKSAGNWAWDIAQKIAIPVAVEAIKKSM